MKLPLTIGFLVLLLAAGCSNYESGYHDGYRDKSANKWLSLVSSRYEKGYQDGAAEKFFSDWMMENEDDITEQSCPVILTELHPLMYLTPGYEETQPGLFSRLAETVN